MVQSAGREQVCSEIFRFYKLCVHHLARRVTHRPLKSRVLIVLEGSKSSVFFVFRTNVRALALVLLTSGAGKVKYSRVLSENSKKSVRKRFFVKISRKNQNPEKNFENLTYGILLGNLQNLDKNLCKMTTKDRKLDFSSVFQRTHEYSKLATREDQRTSGNVLTVTQKTKISSTLRASKSQVTSRFERPMRYSRC